MALSNSQAYSDSEYVRRYERSHETQAEYEARAAFALCENHVGDSWLDACCGFGRHVEQLSLLGCKVVGLDQSRAMLDRARARALERKQTLSYLLGDICHVPCIERFDTISIFADSFGLFEDDVQHIDALLSLGFALKPHGTLLMQFSNRELIMNGPLPAGEEQQSSPVASRSHWRDLTSGRYGWQETVSGSDRSMGWTFDLRTFTASEIRGLLMQAGFDQITFFGALDGSQYNIKSPQMLVKARKMVFSDLLPIID